MKIIKNYLFNVSYQLIIILLPLITVPYITRIFTPNQIGINAYTYSISQYFVLFAGLGVGIYGNRSIAFVKENEERRINTFWSIFFAVLITTTISLIAFFAYLFLFVDEYINIYIIQSLYIFSVALDISWLFMGMEDFKKIVTRNSIVKLIGVIGIFLLVKSSDDLVIYIFILALTHFVGLGLMWFYLPQYIKRFEFVAQDIKKHFIPLLKIYIPQLAIQVYVLMDKTMIGLLANEAEVGYYDMSQKIVKILLSLLTSLGVVMIPHISSLVASKKYKEVEKNIEITVRYLTYFAFPMAFGLSAVSQGLAVWFFGEEYAKTGILMSFSSFIIIAITWSNIFGMQLLMPMMKEREFTISVVSGAIINVIINLLLIPKLGAFGAIIATIVAEFTVTLVQIIIIRKFINVVPHLIASWKGLISALIMALIINLLTINMAPTFSTTFIQILIGIPIYIGMMIFLKSDVQKELFERIFTIISKR